MCGMAVVSTSSLSHHSIFIVKIVNSPTMNFQKKVLWCGFFGGNRLLVIAWSYIPASTRYLANARRSVYPDHFSAATEAKEIFFGLSIRQSTSSITVELARLGYCKGWYYPQHSEGSYERAPHRTAIKSSFGRMVYFDIRQPVWLARTAENKCGESELRGRGCWRSPDNLAARTGMVHAASCTGLRSRKRTR